MNVLLSALISGLGLYLPGVTQEENPSAHNAIFR